MDDTQESSSLESQNHPCEFCGAIPVRKTTSIKSLGMTIGLMVYPCNCMGEVEEQREKQEKWERILSRAKIPPIYRCADLETTGFSPHEKKAIPICIDFASQVTAQYISLHKYGNKKQTTPIKGIGFLGDVGVGKTYYLCAILINLLRQGLIGHCLFLSMPEYYDSIKASFNPESGSSVYEMISGQAKDTLIVAFDDIGAEYGSQWATDELAKVINHRYNYGHPTLFSSNLRTEELAKRIGARTVDRLKDMCRCFLLEGKSLRGKKQ